MRILSLKMPPGTVISRLALQSEFNVSQTPVRDALIRLEEEGLVEVFPQFATVVSKIDVKLAMEAHFLRLSIELEAVRRLAANHPGETAQALEAILLEQQEAMSLTTYDRFDQLDKEFHRVLFEKADIVGLWETVRRQSVHLDRLRMLNLPMPGKLHQVLTDHKAIIEAVRAGNGDAAVTALRAHLSGTLSIVDDICNNHPDYVKRA
ncbi:GntR family transcriptional regulator (plasmid) [Peteryoungia desertarenae]|uniref:GntR family transcriptional regulator n=2 Tax=Peteryoungia desertarenae TaxID=1813451 RepID=A0ABX6QU25_9HYPH|nr:GntR family transcriptional regulator [Peteryoungia desertarenae]